jgi:hypothetical protein
MGEAQIGEQRLDGVFLAVEIADFGRAFRSPHHPGPPLPEGEEGERRFFLGVVPLSPLGREGLGE